MNLVDKINRFEQTSQSVECFNLVFDNCKLEGFEPTELVEIGGIYNTEGTRLLKVGDKTFPHDFTFRCQEVLKEVRERADRYKVHRHFSAKEFTRVVRPEFNTKENGIMSEKEMGLSGNEYKLLQYLRGCKTSFHTSKLISEHLSMSERQVRLLLTEMEQRGIIEKERLMREFCMRIELTEEWI